MKNNSMYIDFHTHAFSDRIAERAIKGLEETSGVKPCTNGTFSDLLRLMDEDGIDKSVVLPIATKPSQATVINEISEKMNGDRIIAFGSVHPDDIGYADQLEYIKSRGIKGIKFHPDYQGFYADDKKMFPIYQLCSDLGLIVVFHAGYDPFSPECIHCTPDMEYRIAKAFPSLRFVFAHMGGMNMFYDVYGVVCGLPNVWIDTSFTYNRIDNHLLLRMIDKHGAERVLMGSDAPWQRPGDSIKQIEALNIPDDKKDWIYYKSAVELLGI